MTIAVKVNFDLLIRDLVESGIRNNKLPEDLVVSERALKFLTKHLGTLLVRNSISAAKPDDIFYESAKSFLRGYAEGKYDK